VSEALTVREATPADIPLVRGLIVEYCRWIDLDLAFQEIAAELDGLPGEYAPPTGTLLLGLAGPRVEGLVAYRRFTDDVCEMKRLYVRPAGRGSGLARTLVISLMAHAASQGYRTMYLDTLPKMSGAQRLYESIGFLDIPPYYDTPIPGTRFMARRLTPWG
jgi:ribosomal protein S18 acetylase RimI-like enzyme